MNVGKKRIIMPLYYIKITKPCRKKEPIFLCICTSFRILNWLIRNKIRTNAVGNSLRE